MPPLTLALTGATGFCGGHLAALATARGHRVLALGRRPARHGVHVPWDAAADAPAPPELRAADLVVHCAAAVGDHPPGSPAERHQHTVNVRATERLLAAAAGTPFVFVSSASVYDPRPDRSLVGEQHPTAAGHLNAYGRTKSRADALALAAGAVVLRPRAVYGPGDPHLVPRLLASVRYGVLALPGGDVELSLTAVENLAEACLAAAGWPPGAYNVADRAPYRRDAALRRVLAAHGRRARLLHVPPGLAALAVGRRPQPTRYALDQLAHRVVLDTRKSRSRGFTPGRDLDDYLAALGSRAGYRAG
ncbi:NAD(P)-dependent oxidoreductase [Kitasatospora sp. YST-16]|uniref:NAD-dependent epimerase/dehydratase family protein n=1 Tax=Kitasatospora sp. YST-16 TaxID=2998080 RepID=UPI002284FCCA|nr:NAD(P)-dependent oxidoreductase [Kitasatospora sp. YST-16]WAL72972.1 NAD(P)-dependent oxidoreductase [Kitasatospora sp. YST-16]